MTEYFCPRREIEAEGFAYATSLSATKRTVGFATSSTSGSVDPDPYLFWVTPKAWSVQDTVTTLYTYAQVENCVSIDSTMLVTFQYVDREDFSGLQPISSIVQPSRERQRHDQCRH